MAASPAVQAHGSPLRAKAIRASITVSTRPRASGRPAPAIVAIGPTKLPKVKAMSMPWEARSAALNGDSQVKRYVYVRG